MSALLAIPGVATALKWGGIALVVVLLLVGLRKQAEQAGRVAERLEATEKANDVQRRMLEAESGRPRSRGELAGSLRDGTF